MTEEIQLLEDKRVRIRYADLGKEIKNKAQKVVGMQDSNHDATYINKSVAVKFFKDKASEHKKSIKNIEEAIVSNEKEIQATKDIMEINKITLGGAKNVLKRTEELVEKIQEL